MRDGETLRNGVPVLERTIALLDLLERDAAGTTIRGAMRELGLPRSTVYRILNTLVAHRLVCRDAAGSFALGPRVSELAARVSRAVTYDVAAIATPLAQALRDRLGEPVKLSVRDGDMAKVVVAILGKHDYSPAPAVGTRYPLHAGAASKTILAYMPAGELERQLSAPLTRYTAKTITDPEKLRADLKKIRQQGFAEEMGEHNGTVHAVAAPVFAPDGQFLGALSIPFLADKDAATRERLRAGVVETAAAISAEIPGSDE
ncbi:IclR family transcriptional regulator [Devosia sp.]|jgi:DNA-binding IclR family transcriptional regulator|uniref:IclR family transcriptional regulator n=1 Tax=Devosia sp. TaxID=1871048 RepID=UPI0037BFC4BA